MRKPSYNNKLVSRALEAKEELRSYLQMFTVDMGWEWLRVRSVLERNAYLLGDEINTKLKIGEPFDVSLLPSYKKLVNDVGNESVQFVNNALSISTQKQEEVAAFAIRDADDIIQIAYGSAVAIDYEHLSDDDLRLLVGNLEDVSGIRNDISVLSGLTVNSIENKIEASSKRFKGSGLFVAGLLGASTIGLSFLLTKYRTWLADSYRKAQFGRYGLTGHAVKYKRMANKGTACIKCLLEDGMIYDSQFDFYDHPNGLCIIVPVFDFMEEPMWETGRMYWDNMFPDEKIALIGKSNYDKLVKGEITLDSLGF